MSDNKYTVQCEKCGAVYTVGNAPHGMTGDFRNFWGNCGKPQLDGTTCWGFTREIIINQILKEE